MHTQARLTPMPVVLLVYDAPNVIKTLETILGRNSYTHERPSLAKLGELLDWRAAEVGGIADKRVYVNRHATDSKQKQRWIRADLPRSGFKVLTEVKRSDDDPIDVDDDMAWLVRERVSNPNLQIAHIYLASNDGKFFRPLLEEIARDHPEINITVIGFEETYWARWRDTFEFLDWRDIPGVFTREIPRFSREELKLSRIHPPAGTEYFQAAVPTGKPEPLVPGPTITVQPNSSEGGALVSCASTSTAASSRLWKRARH